jgi:lipid II:glycine glycyltransferase (peptidoglycan interpeptide bridge formation enzyme)
MIGQKVLPRTQQQLEARKVFNQIEHSISSSSLSAIPVSFARQVYVNITGGESGYFSQNQVVSVLQGYFVLRAPLSFEFSRYNDLGSTPYATGRLTFLVRGRRESAQIYVSLAIQDSQWVISQFNIY